MSRENIESARRLLEDAFNEGKLDVIDEMCADGFVDHDPLMGDRDADGVKQSVAAYRDAFPDIEITIDEIFAAGDKVVTRWTGQGTFENELMGLKPTHETGEAVRGITIDRFEGGKIAESWTSWDTLQLMKDIGAVPAEVAA
jgi:steroid delta-isomerase-like uncharacterized protein